MSSRGRLLTFVVVLRLLAPASSYLLRGGPQRLFTVDSNEYLTLSRSLAADHRFFRDGHAELDRPPGYPVLLLPGMILGFPVFTAMILQAALGCITVALVYATTLILGHGERAALIAGYALAIDPVHLVWSSMVMAEALLTTCVALCCFALLHDLLQPAPRWLVLTAVSAAAAAYVKPVALFLSIWLAAAWLLAGRARHGWRAGATRAALLVAMTVAGLAPWMIRNARVADYAGFSTKVDSVLAFRTTALEIAARERISFPAARREVGETTPRNQRQWAEARNRGLQKVFAHPATFVVDHIAGMGRTLFNPGALPFLDLLALDVRAQTRAVMEPGSLWRRLAVAATNPLLLTTAVAFTLLLLAYLSLAAYSLTVPAPDRALRFVLAGLIIYFLVLSGGPWGQSRFRHPMMPMICVLCGAAIADRVRVRSARRQTR